MDFKAVILDLGGVVLRIDYQATISAFEALGSGDFREMYSQAAQTSIFDRLETGKISGQRFINELLPYLKQGTSPNKVVAAWNAMILDVPTTRLEVIKKIRRSYPLFLLSNTNEIHMQAVRRSWAKSSKQAPEHYFDKIYLSHEVGLRKPDTSIFELVIREQGLIPQETLFIDDSIQHVEGAIKAGLQAFHLTSFEELDQLFS